VLIWKDGKKEVKREDPWNPRAAEMAANYVAQIRKQCGWGTGKSVQIVQLEQKPAHPENFQESERDWELSPEDLAALELVPL
jgi:hypothetical protein